MGNSPKLIRDPVLFPHFLGWQLINSIVHQVGGDNYKLPFHLPAKPRFLFFFILSAFFLWIFLFSFLSFFQFIFSFFLFFLFSSSCWHNCYTWMIISDREHRICRWTLYLPMPLVCGATKAWRRRII